MSSVQGKLFSQVPTSILNFGTLFKFLGVDRVSKINNFRLYRMISCYTKELNAMLRANVVWQPLVKYQVCAKFGISSFYLRDHTAVLNEAVSYVGANDFYAVHLLPREMLAALCNLIGISENRMKQNITLDETQLVNQTLKKYDNANVSESTYNSVFPIPNVASASNESAPSFQSAEYTSAPSQIRRADLPTSLIKPTRTSEVGSESAGDASISFSPKFVPLFPDVIDPDQVKITDESKAVTSAPSYNSVTSLVLRTKNERTFEVEFSLLY